MKKRIACVCVAAMLLTMLGGCKADGPAVSAPEENSAVSSSSTTTTTTTTAEDATTTTTASATVTGDPTTNTTNKPTATATVKPTTTTTTAKPTATTTTTTPPTYPTSVGEDFVTNCRLIVNGRDITKGNHVLYVTSDETYGPHIQLPLFAIMHALGNMVEWIDDNTVMITKNGKKYPVHLGAEGEWCEIQVGGEDMTHHLSGELEYPLFNKRVHNECVLSSYLFSFFLSFDRADNTTCKAGWDGDVYVIEYSNKN